MRFAILFILLVALLSACCLGEAMATTRPATQYDPQPSTQPSGLPEPTRVTLKLDNVPASDAIDALFKQAGLPSLRLPGMVRTIDQLKISLALEHEPFAVAMLELCRKTGQEPETLFETRRIHRAPVTFRPATRGTRPASTEPATRAAPTPTTVAPSVRHGTQRTPSVMGPSDSVGPFVILARGAQRTAEQTLEEPGAPPRRTLALTFALLGDPGVSIHALNTRLSVVEAEDENGVSMVPPQPAEHANWNPPMSSIVRYVWPLSAHLTYPSEQSRWVARLRARLDVSVVRKSDSVELVGDKGVTPGQIKAGHVSCSIRDLGDGGGAKRFMLTIAHPATDQTAWDEIRGLTRSELFHPAVTDAGEPWMVQSHLQGRNNEGFMVMLLVQPRVLATPAPAPPAVNRFKLIWKVPVEIEELAVPVEFDNLPLP